MSLPGVVYFYVCAALALAGASSVIIAKNPIRGAMGLLLLILSVTGLFIALDAQFLAAVQLIVYAGAIVILFLFVIMLLGPSAATPNDRRGLFVRVVGGSTFGLAGLAALAATGRVLWPAHHAPFPPHDPGFGGIDAFGSVLFADTLVPFELSSGLLMVAVVGAIAVARGRQGVKTLTQSERDATADLPAPSTSPQAHTGVFSHEIGGEGHAEGHAEREAEAAPDASLKERPA
jgi:NADH-quinone oxidoreductase subunit J